MDPNSTAKPPVPPASRRETLRQAMEALLREGPLTSRELSGLVGIREKEVAGHLDHLARSLKRAGQRLGVEPAECLACGFVFTKRSRLTRPSACPRCRSQRIEAPVFSLRSE